MSFVCSLGWAHKQEKTPPGSFLKYRAYTSEELTKQILNNSIIGKRYSLHFKQSPKEIVANISNELCLISIKKPIKVYSYYISKSGKIHKKQKLLSRGTLVFADNKGTPIIAWACGNPLSAQLPAIVDRKNIIPANPIEPIIEKIEESPVPLISPIESPVIDIVEDVLIFPPAESIEIIPIDNEIISPILSITETMPSTFLLPGFVAVLPFIAGEKEINPIVIPEPNCGIIIGLLGLYFYRKFFPN